ncbi:MAG: cyclic nucleotide-binding domain-containing protein [Polyangiaceae bacterium]|nr:cyclic nucleotide-binding domain-containing protein [Polyangiaceae bacterium]
MVRSEERTPAEVRRQRDLAAAAVARGRHEAALQAYLALEQLEPGEPDWPKRAADCCRRLNRPGKELAALERAAAGYARGGFTVKAIAICKMILGLDPQHQATQKKLAELHEAQSIGLDRLAGRPRYLSSPPIHLPPPLVDAPPAPLSSTPLASPSLAARPAEEGLLPPISVASPSIPPGAPLEAVVVASLAPSRPTRDLPPQSQTAYEIDLDDVEYLDAPDSVPPTAKSPSAAAPPAEVAAAALPYTPLFSEVSPESFEYLVDQVRLLEIGPGDAVFHEGDRPDELFVIAEGAVEVVAEGPPRERVNLLREGEFFGEIGLLSDVPRQRTVAALEETRLLVLDRRLVSELVDRDPAFLRVILRFLRERLVAMLIRGSELFAPFGPDEQRELVSRFRFLELEAGTTLIEQGKRAEGLYVLLSGGAEVAADGSLEVLASLRPGDVFGEMSLLSGAPAIAGVRTTQKSFALLMPARAFTETVMANPYVLMYTSELADRRAAANQAQRDGSEIVERRLDLV